MNENVDWSEVPYGWIASPCAGIYLVVQRAHRGSGYVWRMDAFHADDDARGIQPTDSSAKHLAEKAYRAWRARQVV